MEDNALKPESNLFFLCFFYVNKLLANIYKNGII